jgi:(p)ppGpp synthase/HD superfamily hydrolase
MGHQELLEKAIAIANKAHEGQASKTGHPFIDHVRRVTEMVEGDDAKLVAWLHDVVEKGPGWSLEKLRAEGFPAPVVEAVDAMTKREGEDYFAFVRRAISNRLARPVKYADLTDNLGQAHQIGDNPSKFINALRMLEEE